MVRRSTGLLAFIAASTPAALGFEWLLRRFLLPPAMDELRDFLRPQLTEVAWSAVALGLVATAAGFALQARVYRATARRLGPERSAQARFETLLIVSSIPQVPALLATVLFTFGAPFLPTIATIAVGTSGVALQWLGVRRLGEVTSAGRPQAPRDPRPRAA